METTLKNRSSDFVLDEGLEDEDEDILAFEASRASLDSPKLSASHKLEADNEVDNEIHIDGAAAKDVGNEITEIKDLTVSSFYPDSVVVDGMPSDANRAHLEAFLEGCGEITSLKVYRFPDKTLAARVQFISESCARSALARNGSPFMRKTAPVSVQPAPANWENFIASHPSKVIPGSQLASRSRDRSTAAPASAGAVMVGGIPVNLAEVLPKPEEVKSAFWNAFCSAKKVAENLEQRARAAGRDLDSKFQLSQNVDEATKRSREAMDNVDTKYHVREKVSSAIVAGKERAGVVAEGAKSVDESLGVSRRISSVSSSIVQAGSKAAREVDENFGVSERARGVANSALDHEKIGPAVRQAMHQWDGLVTNLGSSTNGADLSARKKNYVARGVEPETFVSDDPETLVSDNPESGPSANGVANTSDTELDMPIMDDSTVCGKEGNPSTVSD